MRYEDRKADTAPIAVRFKRTTISEFKKKCIKKDTTMSEVIQNAVDKFLKAK